MPIESYIQRLADDLTPPPGAKERIQRRIEARLASPAFFAEAQKALTPSRKQQEIIWLRIAERIDTQPAIVLLDRLRELLTPPRDLSVALQPFALPRMVPAHVAVRQRTIKWVAAVALFLLVVKAGPQLFLSSSTVAEGAVTLLPTRGEVTVSVGELWQPVMGEITLEPGMLLRTHTGEATLLLRDHGVVRLDAETTIAVESIANPLDTEASTGPAITLMTGRLWVQGLIPPPLNGITIQTAHGLVVVNEGSVSVAADRDDVLVKIWDRRVQVIRDESPTYLIAGEYVRLFENNPLLTKKIPGEEYESDWAVQNLQRDAVHRRSIAQTQQERRAARAGILPTSRLYSVKRIAEKVDVLLTIGEEARTQKRLDHANVRLDEAAALLAGGDVEAMRIPLEHYRDSLLAVAAGSGNLLVQELLAQSLASQAGEVAAFLPNNAGYLIKEAVLQASASVPDGIVSASDVQGILLVDTIAALIAKVDEEETADVKIWNDLQNQLTALDEEASHLRPEVRREAQMLLSEFAFTVTQLHEETGGVDGDLLNAVTAYLPPEVTTVPMLSEEELLAIVQGIRDRIFVYTMQRSRVNQFLTELRALEGHPDQGRILRRLYFALPDGPEELPLRVRKEIIRLQWANAAGQ